MRRNTPVYVATALLLASISTIIWGWWTTHDLEVLEGVRRLPLAGPRLERLVGADVMRPSVTIGVDASYPPFASVDENGALVGFEVDLAAELGSRLAQSARIVNMDAADALNDAIVSRKIDAMIAGLSYTPELTTDIAYSEGYFESGPGIFVRSDRSDIAGPGDLAGKKVVVELGSVGEEEARLLARSTRGMELITVDDVEKALAQVAGGGADATIVDRPSIPAGTSAMAELKPVAFPLRKQPYSVAVSRRDPGLLLAINRELESMRADGTLDRLDATWLR
ncbi:MAG TPA: transporter substrate-binding domain-containing protein [Chloroflexota bacterium]|nr:transporter substrate-binding domain-containing protein [Chloroflexota bacterium]